jgi:hypothetical protein
MFEHSCDWIVEGTELFFAQSVSLGLVILVICFLIWQLFFLIWPLIALSMFSKSAFFVFWKIYWWQKMWPTQRTFVKKLCKSKQILRESFLKWVLVGCQNIAGLLNLSTSYLTCSQIWLIHLVDDHGYGYITTLEGKNAW